MYSLPVEIFFFFFKLDAVNKSGHCAASGWCHITTPPNTRPRMRTSYAPPIIVFLFDTNMLNEMYVCMWEWTSHIPMSCRHVELHTLVDPIPCWWAVPGGHTPSLGLTLPGPHPSEVLSHPISQDGQVGL